MTDTPRALPEWFLKLLSVDTERLQGGTEHVRFARFPEGGWGLVAILAIVVALAFIVWNYRHEGQLRARWKGLLAALRAAIVVGAALIYFYPVLEVDRAQELRATTLLLVDKSLSQTLQDRYQGDPQRREALARALKLQPEEIASQSRAELARRALLDPEARILERLEARNQLKPYAFAGLPLEPLDHDAAPTGTITDLAGALRSAVDEEASGRVAGVVVITDGRVTAGQDLKSVGAILASRGIPVHAVGVGDPSPARNWRVSAVLATERVFAGDPVVVDVRIEELGLQGEIPRVELVDVFEPPGEAPRAPVKIETLEAPFAAGRSETTLSFRFEPQGTGKHRLTARIEPRPDETFSDDNERSIVVEVVKDAAKVLLVAGGPSYEYRFLKNLLRRDNRIFLAAWLMSADPDYPQEGNVSLKKLPSTARDLFEYDVIILMDPDPRGFPEGFSALLEEFVGKRRGGLIYSAGEKFAASFFDAPDTLPIRGLLPVVVDAGDVRDETGRGRFHEKFWPLLPTSSALGHSATRLSSQVDRNRDRWAEVAGLYWSFPVRKAKPGAAVLFVHPDPALQREGQPRVVAAVQFYESGRVLWCGTDSTWRWRATAEEVYDRFWIQTIRYLTESRLAGDRRQLVETDKDAYELGDSMRLSAHLTDESFRPVDQEEALVSVLAPDSDPVEVKLARDTAAPGWFRGIYIPRSTGEHTLRLTTTGNVATQKTVRVDPPAVEFESPRLDEEALKELAALTGGSYSSLAELGAVPDRIEDRRQTVVTTDEPIPLWDNALAMSILAALFTLEWVLRKVFRLL